MRKLGLFPKDTKINFLKYRKGWFLFSFILVVFFLVYPFLHGFNLGVDFRGGIIIVAKPSTNVSIADIKKEVQGLKQLDVTFQEFKNNKTLQITISERSLYNFSNRADAIDVVRDSLKNKATIIKTEFIGPNVSKQLIKGGTISVILALLGIFVYVWLRFDWQYSFIAIITLIHDVIIGVGALTLFNYEINITTIAAVLTIVGYSINDTIITFNQVKENINRYPKLGDVDLLNQSLNDVISRTISTSLTVALVLLSVYLFGGSTLTSFSFTLLIGVIFGTYSSIFLSVPALLYVSNFRSFSKQAIKEEAKSS